ncbi:MAG TPA: hypothetical protein VKD21_02835 [Acidimicrobiales bacterium]|nr:hypothetical protein [Acidimicrobiales bacterium]
MGLTAIPSELHDRLDRATAVSTAARERAVRAVAMAVDAHARAQRVRLDSIDRRTRSDGAQRPRHEVAVGTTGGARSIRAFRVDGFVDDAPAYARWSDHRLDCSPALLDRIEIVVALEETFDPGGGLPVVQASVDGPVKSVLPTVIRAFSRVTSIELAVDRSSRHSERS